MTGLQTMQNFVLLDLKDDFFSMLFHPFYLLPQILDFDLRYPVTGECWCYQCTVLMCYDETNWNVSQVRAMSRETITRVGSQVPICTVVCSEGWDCFCSWFTPTPTLGILCCLIVWKAMLCNCVCNVHIKIFPQPLPWFGLGFVLNWSQHSIRPDNRISNNVKSNTYSQYSVAIAMEAILW